MAGKASIEAVAAHVLLVRDKRQTYGDQDEDLKPTGGTTEQCAVGTLTSTLQHIAAPYVFWHGDGRHLTPSSDPLAAALESQPTHERFDGAIERRRLVQVRSVAGIRDRHLRRAENLRRADSDAVAIEHRHVRCLPFAAPLPQSGEEA